MTTITTTTAKAQSKQSILVAEDVIDDNSALTRSLIDQGYSISAVMNSRDKLSEKCTQLKPDILIINTDSPTTDTLKEITFIDQLSPLPVLIFAKKEISESIRCSIEAGVSAYIVDVVQPHRLNSLISVAVERFKARQTLRNELDQTKKELANRKKIERAKGCIMEQKKISEEEAYKQLRRMAMNNGHSLATVATNVISVCSLLKQSSI